MAVPADFGWVGAELEDGPEGREVDFVGLAGELLMCATGNIPKCTTERRGGHDAHANFIGDDQAMEAT